MRIDDDVAEVLAPYRTLVIACDGNLCTLVQDILGMEGYDDVRKAVRGRGALRTLRQRRHPTIVLLEPLVLQIIGNEALEAYMTDVGRRAPHVVIIMTGMVGIEDYTRKMHFDGFLRMPFEVEELLAAVENAQRLARAKRNRTIH